MTTGLIKDAVQQAGITESECLLQVSNEEKKIYDGMFEFENGKILTLLYKDNDFRLLSDLDSRK
ncbi:hypothetical protein D3C73_764720 [compost metagenome]